jgi:hypothetical protein
LAGRRGGFACGRGPMYSIVPRWWLERFFAMVLLRKAKEIRAVNATIFSVPQ